MKSGDAGSTAREIARRARSAHRVRPRPSAVSSPRSSSHGAIPDNNRPIASRCVTVCRVAPAACSTGIRAFNVPAARLVSTGFATRSSRRTQASRSLAAGAADSRICPVVGRPVNAVPAPAVARNSRRFMGGRYNGFSSRTSAHSNQQSVLSYQFSAISNQLQFQFSVLSSQPSVVKLSGRFQLPASGFRLQHPIPNSDPEPKSRTPNPESRIPNPNSEPEPRTRNPEP